MQTGDDRDALGMSVTKASAVSSAMPGPTIERWAGLARAQARRDSTRRDRAAPGIA